MKEQSLAAQPRRILNCRIARLRRPPRQLKCSRYAAIT
jgi:hypothetical protein